MGENTKIEWADDTFNPWVGCSKVSAACTNCYAESWAKRTGGDALWRGERRRTSAANWRKPIAWNTAALNAGRPRRVFCASLADVFEDHPDLPPWRADLFELIEATPALRWLLLTKRPENIARFRPPRWNEWPSNVWLGTTVENQETFETRVPHLLRERATLRFLSMEPLLGPVGLERLPMALDGFPGSASPLLGSWWPALGDFEAEARGRVEDWSRIGWVIAGGESGHRARPSDPGWFRALRDECVAADVPFLFKQWGEHGEDGRRVGKIAAGRLLDGVQHDGVPS